MNLQLRIFLLCSDLLVYALYEGRYTREIHDYEVVVPRKVHANGSFLSYDLPHYYSREVSRQKRNAPRGEAHVHYTFPVGGEHHHVELWPNHGFMAPGLVVEHRRRHTRDTNLRRLRENQCHYTGIVRGVPHSRAALSVCDGMAGYIRVRGDHMYIEPARKAQPQADGQHTHVIYRDREKNNTKRCAASGDWSEAWASRLRWELDRDPHFLHRSPPVKSYSLSRYLELGVVADKKFLEYYKDEDVETYILTVMNMVSDYYHDSSVGNYIDAVVVRIMYLEKEEEEIDLVINRHAPDTLKSFCKWQMTINPKDEKHPNHHDIAVLLTKHDICSTLDSECEVTGLAKVASACRSDQSCCINEDCGLAVGIVISHEIGHVMGSDHDEEEEKTCSSKNEEGFYYVMSAYVKMKTSGWSNCSKRAITAFLDNSLGDCFLDEPSDQTFTLPSMPAGAMYGASYQCRELFGYLEECPAYEDVKCETLYCKKDKDRCVSAGDPAADGTKCGENMWCYHLECVKMGKRPEAVNGGWSDWSDWSECSRTCGGGVIISERMCNNPAPKNKGRYCLGERKRFRLCNTEPCDVNTPTYREMQCTSYDSKPFNGGLYKWWPIKRKSKDANPCELVCANGGFFASLAPAVKDGTKCRGSTRDVCISGKCLHVGCDWVLGSDAMDDDCGVCRGDGTGCRKVEGTYNEVGSGYQFVTTIPAQSHNIKVVDMDKTKNAFALSDKDGKHFFLNGDSTIQNNGEYDFGSHVYGVYSTPELGRHELIIKGPTAEGLMLFIIYYSSSSVNPGIKYTYYVRDEKNKTYLPHYEWEFVDWGECSAHCGGGTQISPPSCVESQAGKVSSSYCNSSTKPADKFRKCNQQDCLIRWRTGQWGPCSGCMFKSGVQRRRVQCVRQNPHTGKEDIECEPSNCTGKRPNDARFCNSLSPCPSTVRPWKKSPETRKNTSSAEDNIVVDKIPQENTVLIEVPLVPQNESKQMSEEGEELFGEKPSVSLDMEKKVVYKGKEAADKTQEMRKKHKH